MARWLGRSLDKRQQVGDWERRPLYPAQRAYAGTQGDGWKCTTGGEWLTCQARESHFWCTVCDALCLVDIVRVWPALLDAAALQRPTAPSKRAARTSAARTARGGGKTGAEPDTGGGTPMPAPDASGRPRFLVDAMMGGLAKKLRSCGLDVLYGARARCHYAES